MFIEGMKEALNDDYNYNITENGALGYRTTGKELLDLNFRIASLRSVSEEEIIDKFMKVFYENKELAIKWLFFARDVREGLGERRLFRIVIKYLSDTSDLLKDLIKYIPEYGRFDDFLGLLDTKYANIVVDLIKQQLKEDKQGMTEEEPISLLAKWLPSSNATSKESVRKARMLIEAMGMNTKTYRKMLVKMRAYLDVVEVKMTAQEWDKIKYENVPSRANLIYNNAFFRHDEERRRAFLEALEEGETKINASTAYPHDIVHQYMINYRRVKEKNITLEEMWKRLPNLIQGNDNTIVVADGSGSMTSTIGETGVTALSVANALAIYFAERSSGQFKDNYITFSQRPQLVDFSSCESLKEKIDMALLHNEVANTNIKAVFELILKTAINKKMEQSELPQNILIVSDMEFDMCGGEDLDQRLFEVIANDYEQAGYKLPRLVFWNVNSRTRTIPIIENELGVALVSGFSVNIAKMVLSSRLDAYECLMEQLMSERYAPITLAKA